MLAAFAHGLRGTPEVIGLGAVSPRAFPLYARRGLVAAMLAHFCADLVLHVVAPIVIR